MAEEMPAGSLRSSSPSGPPLWQLIAWVAGALVLISLLFLWAGTTTVDAAQGLSWAVAAATSATVFLFLLWLSNGPSLGPLTRMWKEDDPRLMYDVPVVGLTVLTAIAYIFFFYDMEDTVGLLGMVFFTVAIQYLLSAWVGQHVARRYAANKVSERDADNAVFLSLGVIGIPFVLYAILLFFFDIPLFTGNKLGDIIVGAVVLLPLVFGAALIGYAQLYGTSEAVTKIFSTFK